MAKADTRVTATMITTTITACAAKHLPKTSAASASVVKAISMPTMMGNARSFAPKIQSKASMAGVQMVKSASKGRAPPTSAPIRNARKTASALTNPTAHFACVLKAYTCLTASAAHKTHKTLTVPASATLDMNSEVVIASHYPQTHVSLKTPANPSIALLAYQTIRHKATHVTARPGLKTAMGYVKCLS